MLCKNQRDNFGTPIKMGLSIPGRDPEAAGIIILHGKNQRDNFGSRIKIYIIKRHDDRNQNYPAQPPQLSGSFSLGFYRGERGEATGDDGVNGINRCIRRGGSAAPAPGVGGRILETTASTASGDGSVGETRRHPNPKGTFVAPMREFAAPESCAWRRWKKTSQGARAQGKQALYRRVFFSY